MNSSSPARTPVHDLLAKMRMRGEKSKLSRSNPTAHPSPIQIHLNSNDQNDNLNVTPSPLKPLNLDLKGGSSDFPVMSDQNPCGCWSNTFIHCAHFLTKSISNILLNRLQTISGEKCALQGLQQKGTCLHRHPLMAFYVLAPSSSPLQN